MSNSALKLLAASGAKGDPVYVDDVFSTFLYTGTQATLAINNGIDFSGEGGLAWFKCRNVGMLHNLFDTVRGNTQRLDSSGTGAQSAQAAGRYPTFTSTGFTLGADDGGDINYSGREYVSWSFRKAPGFFDIVTYTGNGTAGRTVSHNLGSVPGMIIVKSLTNSFDWQVYHRSKGNTHGGTLNETYAFADSATYWNDTSPTSAQFTVGNGNGVNYNNEPYVAYLFAHDAQDFGTDSDEAIIKCGSYTGNGSTDGPTIDLGFEPQWLLIKNATASSNWMMVDNMRGLPVGGDDATLAADSSASENGVIGAVAAVNILPNGWKNVGGVTASNANGATHIYMAIRRPNKPAEEFAATQLLGLDKPTSGNKITPGFPADFGFTHEAASSGAWYAGSRLTQGTSINFVDAPAESSHANYAWDSMTQFFTGYTWAGYMSYGFRRAPGFFDVVTYTGNQTARQIPHNLGVVPEMMWVKCRSQTRNWAVYLASQGNTKVAQLNGGDSFTADTSSWNNTSPTSTHFTVGDSATTNFNPEPMIAYLFASVPGISKIGTYTGTGTSSNVNVDCGFSSGVRFVLIKRADDVTAWYVWDSVRGIVSGTDPYLRLNQDNAEVTTTDWIDPLSSGFTVTNAAGNDINTSGGTYFFYAIA